MRKPQKWIRHELEGRVEFRALNIVDGFVSLADGLVRVCTLGFYVTSWSLDFTIWRVYRQLNRQSAQQRKDKSSDEG